MYVCVCVYTHICVCMYIYIYIDIDIYTYKDSQRCQDYISTYIGSQRCHDQRLGFNRPQYDRLKRRIRSGQVDSGKDAVVSADGRHLHCHVGCGQSPGPDSLANDDHRVGLAEHSADLPHLLFRQDRPRYGAPSRHRRGQVSVAGPASRSVAPGQRPRVLGQFAVPCAQARRLCGRSVHRTGAQRTRRHPSRP